MIRTSIYSVFLIACLLCISCKRTDSDIGRDILPASDILGATYCDTATVVCYTVWDTTLRSDESYVGGVPTLGGTIVDPVFGRTDANFYTNLTNANNAISLGFGANAKLDSVVLTLAYASGIYYGDLNDPLTFNVYRLTDTIAYSSAYYTNTHKSYDAANDITYYGTGKTCKIDPYTDVYDGDSKYAAHLRIRLKNEIGQEFLDDTAMLASTATLQAAFKGLYITTKHSVVSGNDYGAIAYFDLSNPLSKVSIYCHNGTNFTTRRVDFPMSASSGAANFNQYDYDRSQADPVYLSQLNGNTSTGADHLFIQGMGNSRIKIAFPYLKNFSDSGKIAVNRAEIVFDVDKSTNYFDDTKYFVPSRMALEEIFNDTTIYQLVNDQATNLSGNWGFYDSDNSQFHFPIAWSIQKLANGQTADYKFSMRVYEHQNNPTRVVLGGPHNATYPARLRIWYTRIK